MTYTIDIPNWNPTRLNELLRQHWAKRNRMKKADYEMVGAYRVKCRCPKATKKRKLSYIFTLGKGTKRGDDYNWQKVIDDCLVACGALVDDSPKWMEFAGMTFERGDLPATRIILEDV